MLGRDPCPAEVFFGGLLVEWRLLQVAVKYPILGVDFLKKPDAANACQVQQGTNHRFAANNQDKLSYNGILDTTVRRHLWQAGWRFGKWILIRNALEKHLYP
jgi:hypothetical protein